MSIDYENIFKDNNLKKYSEGYHNFYSTVLSDKNINSILHIGFNDPLSLKLWRGVWPNAKIDGIFQEELPLYYNENFKIFSHNPINAVNAKIIKNNYDLIIDDGNLLWKDKIRTIYNYFNKANKFYIIENIMGEYALKKIFNGCPDLYLTDHFIFNTNKPASFSFRENDVRIEEKNSSYKVLFINAESSNYAKRAIISDSFKESMIYD